MSTGATHILVPAHQVHHQANVDDVTPQEQHMAVCETTSCVGAQPPIQRDACVRIMCTVVILQGVTEKKQSS